MYILSGELHNNYIVEYEIIRFWCYIILFSVDYGMFWSLFGFCIIFSRERNTIYVIFWDFFLSRPNSGPSPPCLPFHARFYHAFTFYCCLPHNDAYSPGIFTHNQRWLPLGSFLTDPFFSFLNEKRICYVLYLHASTVQNKSFLFTA